MNGEGIGQTVLPGAPRDLPQPVKQILTLNLIGGWLVEVYYSRQHYPLELVQRRVFTDKAALLEWMGKELEPASAEVRSLHTVDDRPGGSGG